MPIMDGLVATRKVRALEREFAQEQNDGKEPIRIPIVGLSADIQQSTKEVCHRFTVFFFFFAVLANMLSSIQRN
jgi:CheY-like chemotaxis protein